MPDIFDELTRKPDIFDQVADIGGSMPVSAVTGQPVQTDTEKINLSKRAMGEVLPLAGNIVGAAVMPQLGVAKSAPLLARGAAGLANIALRSAGAGAGSVVGETERQLMTKDYDPNQIKVQGAMGAASEAIPGLVAPALKAVEKPGLELAADLTVSGTKLKTYFADRIKKQAAERVENFIADVAPASIKKRIDEVGINKAVNDAFDESKLIYGHFKEGLSKIASENSGYVPLEKTSQAMQQWLKDVLPQYKNQSQAESAIVKSFGWSPGGLKEHQHIVIRKLARGDDLTESEVNYLLSNINVRKTEDYIKMHPDMQGLRQTLKENIIADLDNLGAGASKRTADEMTREAKNFQRIKGIYDSASPANRETGERTFYPYLFAQNVYRNERTIRQTMPDVWPKIKAEADRLMQDSARIEAGNRNMGVLAGAGLASSAFTGYIPVGEAFGAASAWALMTPSGKSALHGAFKYAVMPATKGALQMGGRLIDLQPSHK